MGYQCPFYVLFNVLLDTRSLMPCKSNEIRGPFTANPEPIQRTHTYESIYCNHFWYQILYLRYNNRQLTLSGSWWNLSLAVFTCLVLTLNPQGWCWEGKKLWSGEGLRDSWTSRGTNWNVWLSLPSPSSLPGWPVGEARALTAGSPSYLAQDSGKLKEEISWELEEMRALLPPMPAGELADLQNMRELKHGLNFILQEVSWATASLLPFKSANVSCGSNLTIWRRELWEM